MKQKIYERGHKNSLSYLCISSECVQSIEPFPSVFFAETNKQEDEIK